MIAFIYTGAKDQVIPPNATHIFIHKSIRKIPAYTFQDHPNIIELICHEGVEKIMWGAFMGCENLKRVIIPGVKIVAMDAFSCCVALTYIECNNVERIGYQAFSYCESLRSINLPSIKAVDRSAFSNCESIVTIGLGKDLNLVKEMAFFSCHHLRRITVPLKNGLFETDDVFMECGDLESIDLIEGAVIRDTIAALQLEEWRDDMNYEMHSINEILPEKKAGDQDYYNEWGGGEDDVVGEKTVAVREWIAIVLGKIIEYKSKHRRLLNETARVLEVNLPNNVMENCVLPFLDLPSHIFEGEVEGGINCEGNDILELHPAPEEVADQEPHADRAEHNDDEKGGENNYDSPSSSSSEIDEEEGRKRRKTGNEEQ